MIRIENKPMYQLWLKVANCYLRMFNKMGILTNSRFYVRANHYIYDIINDSDSVRIISDLSDKYNIEEDLLIENIIDKFLDDIDSVNEEAKNIISVSYGYNPFFRILRVPLVTHIVDNSMYTLSLSAVRDLQK